MTEPARIDLLCEVALRHDFAAALAHAGHRVLRRQLWGIAGPPAG